MFNEEHRFTNPLRWGMVGGGRGSEIGYAHRSAAQRDNLFQLVAGAFDLNSERGKEFGNNIGVSNDRCYSNYKEMFAAESERKDGIQAVSIATPNSTHYEICKAALFSGLHIVCEKPLTFTTEEALHLETIAKENNCIIGVMYGYAGFPMVQQAKEMIQRGDLGDIRIVNMQFAHGFHHQEIEKDNPGLKWRVTPEASGPTYVIGDLGTHTYHMAEFMTGLKIDRLSCMRQSFIESRAPLEDNAHVMMQFEGGAVGTLWASAVNAGSMHQQRVRVVGSKASIEWWDEHPNQLRYEVQGEPLRILDRAMPYLYQDDDGVSANRIGGGHAEGFFESWANLYHRFGIVFNAAIINDWDTVNKTWYPDIKSGVDGVRLCEKCAESANKNAAWVNFND